MKLDDFIASVETRLLTIHPDDTLVCTIDCAEFLNFVPAEVRYDQEKVDEYMNMVVAGLEAKLNEVLLSNYGPEHRNAIVMFDTLSLDVRSPQC